jgi:hypothetical protein
MDMRFMSERLWHDKWGGHVLAQERRGSFVGRGFLMSLEAAASFLLVLSAASLLPHLYLAENSAQAGDFFMCSDAALLLSKTNAFSGAALQEKVEKLSRLSGMCIEADSPDASASSCESGAGEQFAFNFPVWQAGELRQASVSCWRGE